MEMEKPKKINYKSSGLEKEALEVFLKTGHKWSDFEKFALNERCYEVEGWNDLQLLYSTRDRAALKKLTQFFWCMYLDESHRDSKKLNIVGINLTNLKNGLINNGWDPSEVLQAIKDNIHRQVLQNIRDPWARFKTYAFKNPKTLSIEFFKKLKK